MIIFSKNNINNYMGGVKRPSLIHYTLDNYCSPLEESRC